MGDFNIDILDTEIRNTDTTKLLDTTQQYGLQQLIKSPTRYTAIKNTCIDLCFRNSDIINDAGVADINLSDHQIIVFTRKKLKIKTTKCNFIGRSYRNYNKAIFQSLIHESPCIEYDECQDINRKWEIMAESYISMPDNYIPTDRSIGTRISRS